MKKSLFSTSHRRPRLHTALLVLLLLITSFASCFAAETSPDSTNIARKSHYNPRHYFHRPCDSFSHEKPRSLCNQFHKNRLHSRHLPPPPPPPPSQLGEIDPRYGIEKRLVPSGPNPLHN